MKEPEWIDYHVAVAIQEMQLAEHGGRGGIRDQGLLEFALARSRHLFAYSQNVSLERLASAYAAGIVRNHPFVNGNKRAAWVICALFHELNGKPVTVEQAQVVSMVIALAERSVTEEQFAEWLQQDG
jgi:death-on-curing protein